MYEDRVLAFIDILGFSDAINHTINAGNEDEHETARIDHLIEQVQTDLNLFGKYYEITPEIDGTKIASQFSDSVIISYSMDAEASIYNILLDILFLCITAVNNGFLFRGSIVCDKIYHTSEKIFGPALVKAYNQEGKLAIYPRIIVEDSIFDLARVHHAHQNSPDQEEEYVRHILKQDFDGLYYVDYFGAVESVLGIDIEEMPTYFQELLDIVSKMKSNKNYSVVSKYLWAKEKLNEVLKIYKKNYDVPRAEAEYPEIYEYYKRVELL